MRKRLGVTGICDFLERLFEPVSFSQTPALSPFLTLDAVFAPLPLLSVVLYQPEKGKSPVCCAFSLFESVLTCCPQLAPLQTFHAFRCCFLRCRSNSMARSRASFCFWSAASSPSSFPACATAVSFSTCSEYSFYCTFSKQKTASVRELFS